MQYFPNLKQGDPINRRWFNDLIGFCNSLVLRGDGRTTRVNRTASGTTVSTIPQPVTAGGGGGAFRNFAMAPDAAGTGIVIGEGCYYLESGGVRNLYRQAPSAVTSANMPPADGKIYYYCLGMRGAPPWIGGTLGTFPGWTGNIGGTAPAGLTPVVIGAVKMTTPVQVFQPPTLGVPVIPALPSEDFAVYATYNRTSAPDNAYPDFSHIPPSGIHVNNGWCSYVTNYDGNDYPPKNTWRKISAATFGSAEFSSGTVMVCVRMGAPSAGGDIILSHNFNTAYYFNDRVWDYTTGNAIVPIADVGYNPSTKNFWLHQHKTGTVYAVPLYNPNE